MKQTLISIRALLACLLLNGLLTGCTPGEPSANPPVNCRIQQLVSTAKTGESVSTTTTNYEYDPAGNLLRKMQTTQASSQQPNVAATDQYTYDNASFLTRSVASKTIKTTLTTGVSTFQLLTTTDYTYTDHRLTAAVQRTERSETGVGSPQSSTMVSTRTYTYDAAGGLTQTSENGLVAFYRNGQVVRYEGPFSYGVENGLIVRAGFPGTNGAGGRADLTQRWQYDGQRRVVRYEETINDSLTQYYTQEWQEGNPSSASLPAFKGHPVVQSPTGEPGLITKFQFYYINEKQGNRAYLFSETTTANQLNAQGYVTSSTATTTYLTNGQPPTITTTDYTYTGCN